MEKNEVKKELLKTKEMASFSHYCAGNLYYHVKVGFDVYQFPIPTVKEKREYFPSEDGGDEIDFEYIELSEDIGTTYFHREMRGSELNRWIDMAIDSGEFLVVETPISPI